MGQIRGLGTGLTNPDSVEVPSLEYEPVGVNLLVPTMALAPARFYAYHVFSTLYHESQLQIFVRDDGFNSFAFMDQELNSLLEANGMQDVPLGRLWDLFFMDWVEQRVDSAPVEDMRELGFLAIAA